MFAVQILDALAEAAVLLLFDIAPTCTSSEDDDNCACTSACITAVNSCGSLDSSVPRGQMKAMPHDNTDSSSPPTYSSMDGSSYVQLTMEEILLMQQEQAREGNEPARRRQGSSCTSVSSGWTAAGRPLVRNPSFDTEDES
ncbi:hypothetical protein DQ04_04191050 [Trypanosoma grayi]|uniref:hypothetical protein n=1 Tax=Trypanosoma grayi TaxID=71804 RepID=UPI0004F3F21F|nr:hypothetical protein DQ04_04191050 [Trypanosoma grayi]KEG10094.1 hypothetical protein DQ04_04191050 [Trypanosoma grayi]